MKRLAIAVLLVLFLLSSAVPGATLPINLSEIQAPIETNPGIQTPGAYFDLFSQPVVTRANPIDTAVADLNGDGRNDFAIIFSGSLLVDIYLCDSNGKFPDSPSLTRVVDYQPTAIAAGDMDGDDALDLVVTLNNLGSNNVLVLYQKDNFQTSLALKFNTDLRPHRLALVDLDKDGELDVVILVSRDSATEKASVRLHFKGDGFILNNSIELTPDTGMQRPRLLEVGDINNDGLIDIIVGDQAIGKVAVYRNHKHQTAPSGAW